MYETSVVCSYIEAAAENCRLRLTYYAVRCYNNEDMHTIYDCVNSFCSLLDTEYHLVLGWKGVAVELGIRFGKKDCFHVYFDYERPVLLFLPSISQFR